MPKVFTGETKRVFPVGNRKIFADESGNRYAKIYGKMFPLVKKEGQEVANVQEEKR